MKETPGKKKTKGKKTRDKNKIKMNRKKGIYYHAGASLQKKRCNL